MESKKIKDKTYNRSSHMDWIDAQNLGISHFGFHPNLLRRDNIRFDVFHLRCAITRRLMAYLRKFMLQQPTELIVKFGELLLTFWRNHCVLVWNTNRPFSSFIGKELLAFINNTINIVDYLKENFIETIVLNDLCNSLIEWEHISPFLLKTSIENVTVYKQELKDFINHLKLFYEIGAQSFLTKDARVVGGDETFYMHCLRFYLPHIAQLTLERHGLGLGIFTMQGFERRNKESKNTLRRFCNGKGDILSPNMKRLYDVWYWMHNAV